MASRIPLVLDEDNSQLRELPVGDDLDLTGNNITGLTSITTTSTITAGGSITSPLVLATNATVSGNVEALTYTIGGTNLLESIEFDDLLNAPTIPTDVNQLQDTDGLLGGGFSGDYNDLSNKPFIPNDINQLGDNDGIIPTDLADLTDNSNLLVGGTFESLGDAFTFDGRADQLVVVNATEENLTTITTASILNGLTSAQVTGALGFTPYNSTNPDGYINSSVGITDALGFTPYDSANPAGYITGISEQNVLDALGFTPYNGDTNPNNYLVSITSGNVTDALGFTPYDAANPDGYITSVGSLNDVLTIGSTTALSFEAGAFTSSGRVTATDIQLSAGGINLNHTTATSIDGQAGLSLTVGGTSDLTIDSGTTITVGASMIPNSGTLNVGNSGNTFANVYATTINATTLTSSSTLALNAAGSTITLNADGVIMTSDYVQLAPSGGSADADRPGTPVTGMYMYNSTHGYHQLYDGGREFSNAGGTGFVTGGWTTIIPPVGGTPNADDTYVGMLAIADGTSWNPLGDGSQALMVFINGAWTAMQEF